MKSALAVPIVLWLMTVGAQASVIETAVASWAHGSNTPDFLGTGTTLNQGLDSHTVLTNLETSLVSYYRSPFEGTASFETAAGLYTAVEGNAVAGFNMAGTKLGLVWGSPDTWNQITFFAGPNGTGGQVGSVVTGNDVIPTNGLGAHYALISAAGHFGSFELSNLNGYNAFEVADLQAFSGPSGGQSEGSGPADGGPGNPQAFSGAPSWQSDDASDFLLSNSAIDLQMSAVPLPAAAPLFAAALIALGGLGYARGRRAGPVASA